ncbi:hypothetical protein PIB30_079197 [Stylosanthes scabra]|uniref:Uncharacterized protein n=1 Tax=Stylosanthes scabra TaxID=79078 RepID=A0ABU6QRQ3_9FABA|nr:hypothetical protein [Stylosanthes scabra]
MGLLTSPRLVSHHSGVVNLAKIGGPNDVPASVWYQSKADTPEPLNPPTEADSSSPNQQIGPIQDVSPMPKRIRKPPTWVHDYHMGK